MTFRYKGKTLTELHRSLANKAAWVKKLARNAGPKLNRLAGIVEITPASLTGNSRRITLRYVGNPEELEKNIGRINTVLQTVFTDNQAVVQFGRIQVKVVLEIPTVKALAA